MGEGLEYKHQYLSSTKFQTNTKFQGSITKWILEQLHKFVEQVLRVRGAGGGFGMELDREKGE